MGPRALPRGLSWTLRNKAPPPLPLALGASDPTPGVQRASLPITPVGGGGGLTPGAGRAGGLGALSPLTAKNPWAALASGPAHRPLRRLHGATCPDPPSPSHPLLGVMFLGGRLWHPCLPSRTPWAHSQPPLHPLPAARPLRSRHGPRRTRGQSQPRVRRSSTRGGGVTRGAARGGVGGVTCFYPALESCALALWGTPSEGTGSGLRAVALTGKTLHARGGREQVTVVSTRNSHTCSFPHGPHRPAPAHAARGRPSLGGAWGVQVSRRVC